MRIVMINWARFADGAQAGGGVNGYCRQLALELTARGHQVAWLSGGLSYVAGAIPGSMQPCEVRRLHDDSGVQVYEVFNSPVLAPGIFQFREPLGEVSSPELEAELTRFFQLWRPDVVHFHNIEGFSCGCINAARTAGPGWKGASVFFSLHNYHTVCPQVYLMQKGATPCFDFDNGHACVGCVEGHDSTRERWIRAGVEPDRAEAHREGPPLSPPSPSPLLGRVVGAFKRRLHEPLPLPVIDPPLPGRRIEQSSDIEPEANSNAHAVRHVAPWSEEQLLSPTWRPLTNECVPPPACSRAVNEYGTRRKAMVEMLSRCDGVFAVSSFVRRKFESLGVSPRVLRELPIGTRMAELVERTPWAMRTRRPASGRPVRLAFMGYNNTFKGLPMLLDSLELLVPEVLGSLELFIWAKDIHRDEARVEGFRARLGGLHVRGSYRYEDVPSMLCGIDAGLVPSIWWDNGPQTVMEFLACGVPVIGAALGGIVDIVHDGVNGLLYTGNDRFALAATLARVVREPSTLQKLAAGIQPPRTMAAHTSEVLAAYKAAMSAEK